uniref:Uncharacterized protein n=1 Tax=Tanacetum cinerariifolium TaxID=118510 RepID=A0A699JEZ1_TANCI|nr:hypothetical protein [Tanacetum cinerariifolium]
MGLREPVSSGLSFVLAASNDPATSSDHKGPFVSSCFVMWLWGRFPSYSDRVIHLLHPMAHQNWYQHYRDEEDEWR